MSPDCLMNRIDVGSAMQDLSPDARQGRAARVPSVYGPPRQDPCGPGKWRHMTAHRARDGTPRHTPGKRATLRQDSRSRRMRRCGVGVRDARAGGQRANTTRPRRRSCCQPRTRAIRASAAAGAGPIPRPIPSGSSPPALPAPPTGTATAQVHVTARSQGRRCPFFWRPRPRHRPHRPPGPETVRVVLGRIPIRPSPEPEHARRGGRGDGLRRRPIGRHRYGPGDERPGAPSGAGISGRAVGGRTPCPSRDTSVPHCHTGPCDAILTAAPNAKHAALSTPEADRPVWSRHQPILQGSCTCGSGCPLDAAPAPRSAPIGPTTRNHRFTNIVASPPRRAGVNGRLSIESMTRPGGTRATRLNAVTPGRLPLLPGSMPRRVIDSMDSRPFTPARRGGRGPRCS